MIVPKDFLEIDSMNNVAYQYAHHAWELVKKQANDINSIKESTSIEGTILNPFLIML